MVEKEGHSLMFTKGQRIVKFVSWYLIIAAVLAALAYLGMIISLMFDGDSIEFNNPEIAAVFIGSFIQILMGLQMLKGRSWAKSGYIVLGGAVLVLQVINIFQGITPSWLLVISTSIVLYFLLRKEVAVYFKEAVSPGI